MSVSAASTPVTETREEAVGTAKAGKDGEESESEYRNLAQVPCIRYPINFGKKSVSALLDSEARSMQSTQPLPRN